eukprot:Amastigsp_a181542_4.p3 type:complete len:124 gc:universal Amastigsp_a181542_4:458-87(-)
MAVVRDPLEQRRHRLMLDYCGQRERHVREREWVSYRADERGRERMHVGAHAQREHVLNWKRRAEAAHHREIKDKPAGPHGLAVDRGPLADHASPELHRHHDDNDGRVRRLRGFVRVDRVDLPL